MIATLFLHLGILEPALIGIWLQVSNKLEQNLGLFKPRLALRIVSQVKDDTPVYFARNVENSREGFFNDCLESILLLFFHLSANLLVLVLAVGCLSQVLFETLDTVPA